MKFSSYTAKRLLRSIRNIVLNNIKVIYTIIVVIVIVIFRDKIHEYLIGFKTIVMLSIVMIGTAIGLGGTS